MEKMLVGMEFVNGALALWQSHLMVFVECFIIKKNVKASYN